MVITNVTTFRITISVLKFKLRNSNFKGLIHWNPLNDKERQGGKGVDILPLLILGTTCPNNTPNTLNYIDREPCNGT